MLKLYSENNLVLYEITQNDRFIWKILRGIASGKSTTANIFKEKQIPVIDADVFARLSKNTIIISQVESRLFINIVVHIAVVKPGQKAWDEIHNEFGNDVFLEDGQLNREALGKIIFADINKRKILNKITHPKIQKMMFWAVIKYFFEGLYFISLRFLCNLSDSYLI